MLTLDDFPEKAVLFSNLRKLNPNSIVDIDIIEQSDDVLSIKVEIVGKHFHYSDILNLTSPKKESVNNTVESTINSNWTTVKQERNLVRTCSKLLSVAEELVPKKLQELVNQHVNLQQEVDKLRLGVI